MVRNGMLATASALGAAAVAVVVGGCGASVEAEENLGRKEEAVTASSGRFLTLTHSDNQQEIWHFSGSFQLAPGEVPINTNWSSSYTNCINVYTSPGNWTRPECASSFTFNGFYLVDSIYRYPGEIPDTRPTDPAEQFSYTIENPTLSYNAMMRTVTFDMTVHNYGACSGGYCKYGPAITVGLYVNTKQGVYQFKNKVSGLCLSFDGTPGKVAIEQTACDSTKDWQRWTLLAQPTGYVVRYANPAFGNYAFDVGTNPTWYDTLKWTAAFNTAAVTTGQLFEVTDQGGGYVQLAPKALSGGCVDNPASSTVDGKDMILYPCYGTSNQQFQLLPL